eukprot:TRINITY_DN16136_c0_g1_i1.p2 TRINITY_DN16136_c0_g1~~TRINITY_DN16136_c0_g1_i1.p2  ORF type:complete len:112 (+),score=8.49 TRINITY_DN16136_c0_g1_i1:150-485(+)
MLNNSSSPIDERLESEDCTLEQLLDEDEVIQECNALNAKLIDFLSKPEVVRKLITFITVFPDEEKRRRKALHKIPLCSVRTFSKCRGIDVGCHVRRRTRPFRLSPEIFGSG